MHAQKGRQDAPEPRQQAADRVPPRWLGRVLGDG